MGGKRLFPSSAFPIRQGGCFSDLAQYSKNSHTPSLRVAAFEDEDDDEDENEAPCEFPLLPPV